MSKKNNVEKRKIKLQEKKKKTQRMIGLAVILIAISSIVAVAAVSLNNNQDIKKDTKPTKTDTVESSDQISIPLFDISESSSFYTYNSGGVDITYFIVKDKQGNIHAAFDACDVCYHAKEGYVQDGDVMVCVNCGLTFPIADIGESNTGGGCWPSYLPISIVDDTIFIEKSDLDSKKFMFQ